MNVSQKPQSSVGFSAVSMKTYNKMLRNQELIEQIQHGPNFTTVKVVTFNLESLRLPNTNKLVMKLGSNMNEARKKIAKMLNIGDVLETMKGWKEVLVTGRNPYSAHNADIFHKKLYNTPPSFKNH